MGTMFSTLERGAHLIGVYVERFAGDLGITQAEAHVLVELRREGPTPITTPLRRPAFPVTTPRYANRY